MKNLYQAIIGDEDVVSVYQLFTSEHHEHTISEANAKDIHNHEIMSIQGTSSYRHRDKLEFAQRTPINGHESVNSLSGPSLPTSYLPRLDGHAEIYKVTGCYEEDELRTKYQRRKRRSLRKVQTLQEEWIPLHFGRNESRSALNQEKQVQEQEVQITDRSPQSTYINAKPPDHQDELHPNLQHNYEGADQAHAKAAEQQSEPNLYTKAVHRSGKPPGPRQHRFNKHKV